MPLPRRAPTLAAAVCLRPAIGTCCTLPPRLPVPGPPPCAFASLPPVASLEWSTGIALDTLTIFGAPARDARHPLGDQPLLTGPPDPAWQRSAAWPAGAPCCLPASPPLSVRLDGDGGCTGRVVQSLVSSSSRLPTKAQVRQAARVSPIHGGRLVRIAACGRGRAVLLCGAIHDVGCHLLVPTLSRCTLWWLGSCRCRCGVCEMSLVVFGGKGNGGARREGGKERRGACRGV